MGPGTVRGIFGVDPGLHVGLLWFRLDTLNVEQTVLPPFEAADWVERKLLAGDVIGAERFTQGRRAKTDQGDALEVIGMMKLIAFRRGASLTIQGASDATKVAPNDVIRALGWWRRGDPDHVRRAATQAAYVWFRMDPDSFEKRTRPGIVV